MDTLSKKILSLLKDFNPDSELATDEFYNTIDIENDPYLDELIMNGQFISVEGAMICDYPLGDCHSSVSKILNSDEREEGDVLYTGYAMNHYNNEWFQHSFIVNNGKIIESGNILFKSYFGIPLIGNQESEFIQKWL